MDHKRAPTTMDRAGSQRSLWKIGFRVLIAFLSLLILFFLLAKLPALASGYFQILMGT
jgi:hypothetical protein